MFFFLGHSLSLQVALSLAFLNLDFYSVIQLFDGLLTMVFAFV